MMPLITVGPLRLSSYGICLVIALGVWWWWCVREISIPSLVDPDSMIFAMAVGAWLGGRIGYVIGSVAIWPQLMNVRALEFSWPGAIIGAGCALLLLRQWRPFSFVTLLDALALPTLSAQSIGAIGLWLAGAAVGVPWDGTWAVAQAGALRHPVQLYESGIAILVALWCILAPRLLPSIQSRWWLIGGIALNWLIVEGFRADSFSLSDGIRIIQFVGLGLLIVVSERVMMTMHLRVKS